MRLFLLIAALLSASALGGIALWERLYPVKPKPRDLNSELLGAAGAGRLDKVRWLLKAGADPNATVGGTNLTAIHFVMVAPDGKPRKEAERLAITRTLIEKGANPHAAIWPKGDTALIWAAGSGYPTIVRYLLTLKPSKAERQRALRIAARRSATDPVERQRLASIRQALGG